MIYLGEQLKMNMLTKHILDAQWTQTCSMLTFVAVLYLGKYRLHTLNSIVEGCVTGK